MKESDIIDEMQKRPCLQDEKTLCGPRDIPMITKRKLNIDEDPNYYREQNEKMDTRVVQNIYRPVAMFGKWLGVLPFEGIYKWSLLPKKVSNILAIVILPLIAIALQMTAAVKIAHLHIATTAADPIQNSISYYASITENVCIIVSGVLCSFNLYLKTGRLVDFLNDLNKLNYLFVKEELHLKKFVYFYFIVAFVTFTVNAASWIYLFKDYDVFFENDDDDVGLLMIIVYVGMVIFLMGQLVLEVTYIIVLRILAKSFNKIKKQILNISSYDFDGDSECATRIQTMRLTHQKLLNMTDEIDCILHPGLLVNILANMINCSFTVYHLFEMGLPQNYESDESEEFYYPYNYFFKVFLLKVTIASIAFVRIAALCIAADETARQASNTAIEIYSTTVPLKHTEVANEIQLFAQMLSGHPVQFSASRYLVIDRSLLTTVIGIIVSYVIVMLQFPDEKEPEAAYHDPDNLTTSTAVPET